MSETVLPLRTSYVTTAVTSISTLIWFSISYAFTTAPYWQSLNRPDISSVGTTLQSQHESFIGYVEEVTFDASLDNSDGYLTLKRDGHDSEESEITSLCFRLTSGSPGAAGGGTKSEMVLSELNIGELVVVYFTHKGEAVWVAYPESIDYDAPNLLK